jgi:site-specific DNA-methyltransferase (adenine-specific)
MTVTLHDGDCRGVLAGLPAASVDSCVTDPPYELGFMGKSWDGTGIANSVAMWAEVYRVLKPGAHLVAFSGSRTYHRMACAIEDAGFEIRDQIMWLYGSGFPKSHDVGKGFDKAAGAERNVVGTRSGRAATPQNGIAGGRTIGGVSSAYDGSAITAPATDLARQWDGWGTALKPAHEPIVLARKPLIGTVAANVARHGTGALNIDATRVGTVDDTARPVYAGSGNPENWRTGNRDCTTGGSPLGRWPANVCHDGSDEVLEAFARFGEKTAGVAVKRNLDGRTYNAHQDWGLRAKAGADIGYADTGTAARFFYCGKATKAERDAGLEELPLTPHSDKHFASPRLNDPRMDHEQSRSPSRNTHPTVKPLALMRWLCRLVTPPGGTVLDPFLGSGSTAIAACQEGFSCIGIEREAEYMAIARARIAADAPLFADVA